MPKVKTTYVYKIQSIFNEFSDKIMESINYYEFLSSASSKNAYKILFH